jgi:hypothetical protein
MGLGPRKDVSLASTRRLAAEARRQLLDSVDPIEARKAERVPQKLKEARGTTFEAATERMITAHEAGWRNPKHRQQWRNTLMTYVYPVLGHLSVGAIDTSLVIKVLEPIWTKKIETASRVRGRVEAVLNWAKANGMRDRARRNGAGISTSSCRLGPRHATCAIIQHCRTLRSRHSWPRSGPVAVLPRVRLSL